MDHADLSAEDRAEVVRLVRLVQTDFDPEADPRGWDSVAVLVRGVGYGDDAIRRMAYPELMAVFRTSAHQMRLQKTGSVACGIATSTSTIVSMDNPEAPPKSQSRPRGETAAERLQALWRDPTGRREILAAGSAERIAHLIGKSKTQVVSAGRIWDSEIKPRLEAQRSMVRYHREEERLDR